MESLLIENHALMMYNPFLENKKVEITFNFFLILNYFEGFHSLKNAFTFSKL
jgi:hypothetical protein